MTDLDDLIQDVHNLDSFLAFMRALIADWEAFIQCERAAPSDPFGPTAHGWENGTIGDFLAAAAAWASDTRLNMIQGESDDLNWHVLARFLYAGKGYE